MKKYLIILPVALLLLSCSKSRPEQSEDHPVLLSLDTKSLGTGEKTFRVALFNLLNKAFLTEGTYCSDLITFAGTFPYGRWLSPCRVDDDGLPLDSSGDEAVGLAQADKDSKYGLRYGTNSGYYLVAASPAKAFTSDGSLRYYPWTAATATDIYVSAPVVSTLSGTWLDGEYVYASSTRGALNLKNHSASIKIHIECDALSTAYIQRVTLLNCVTSARWYLTSGFSTTPEHYTTGSYTLFDYSTNGEIMMLTKDPEVSWTSSTEVFVPSIDYSDNTYSAMRPVIEVRMGNDTAHPAIALIDITEIVEPMKNYTYNLKVSKSQVYIYLSVASWDDGGTINSVDNEAPGLIGTVTVDGWSDGGTNTADPLIDPQS